MFAMFAKNHAFLAWRRSVDDILEDQSREQLPSGLAHSWFAAGLTVDEAVERQPARESLSECEACGRLKPDCVSTTTGGCFPMDVYACAECRGA